MGLDIKTFKEAAARMLHVWQESSSFFLSIELWMMVLMAACTVGGAFLALMGEAWSLPVLAFGFGYIPMRAVLHVKRILAWPFL